MAYTNYGQYEKNLPALGNNLMRRGIKWPLTFIKRSLENGNSDTIFPLRDWFFPITNQDGSGNSHHYSRRTKTWSRNQ